MVFADSTKGAGLKLVPLSLENELDARSFRHLAAWCMYDDQKQKQQQRAAQDSRWRWL